MTPIEALQLLDQAVAEARLPRYGHQQAVIAIDVLRKELTEPKASEAAESKTTHQKSQASA